MNECIHTFVFGNYYTKGHKVVKTRTVGEESYIVVVFLLLFPVYFSVVEGVVA